jgi:hypothetical protein
MSKQTVFCYVDEYGTKLIVDTKNEKRPTVYYFTGVVKKMTLEAARKLVRFHKQHGFELVATVG